ncbi:MAG TPA: structural protein [Candidatus Saccharimonadales bacterium]|nr:structural protein [Candidatus Saccharimonadales bacterium]
MGKVISSIRGIRNNNPTNMVDSGIRWQGMIGVDPEGFLIFDTMANGLRAPAINLRNYGRLDGITTVDGVARRWSKTDQDAYSANLAAFLGVDPQDNIDLEDKGTLTELVRGIIRQEDGGAAELLVDGQVAAAVANV